MNQLQELKIYGVKNRQLHLVSTDWCTIRAIEDPSKPAPQEELDKRQRARDEIARINDANTYDEVSDLDVIFE